MVTDAVLSFDGVYRYCLSRVWDGAKQMLVVCMVNPSTADATENDPTILTLIHFATLWEFGGLLVVNENAFRSPSPAVMLAAADSVGPLNREYLYDAASYAKSTTGWALCAWGNAGTPTNDFVFWCLQLDVKMKCLGMTADGSPKHPLARGVHRIPRNQQPLEWNVP